MNLSAVNVETTRALRSWREPLEESQVAELATQAEVTEKVRSLIGEMCPLGAREVQSEQRLVEDLGYDSVSFLELALALESEFELFTIDEEQAASLLTVGDIEALMTQLAAPAA